jgi:hypothetical protein
VIDSGIEQGQRFCFRLGDVICPDRQEAVSQITPELEVTGKVVFLSDCGNEPERFAVVEVNGVYTPLVVPVERLRPTSEVEIISSTMGSRHSSSLSGG